MWNINCFLNYHLLNHIATDVIWKQDNNLNPVVFNIWSPDYFQRLEMIVGDQYKCSGPALTQNHWPECEYLELLVHSCQSTWKILGIIWHFYQELSMHSQLSYRRSYHPNPSVTSTFLPALFIIHNIISLSGMHSSKILPLSTTALFQRPFFCTSCEMVVALGPRETAVIELHSNQRRHLIDFPTHSTLMVSSRHKIPH